MKRFLILGYYEYYPSGGLNDYVCDVDSAEELIPYKKELEGCVGLDILDFETRETMKNVDFGDLIEFIISM